MANHQRRRPRTSSCGRTGGSRGHGGYWLRNWPKWWDVVYHTRPNRRRNRACEILVMQGVDPDQIAWPLSKKPHIYYW